MRKNGIAFNRYVKSVKQKNGLRRKNAYVRDLPKDSPQNLLKSNSF